MIVIIDYGSGNVRAIGNIYDRLNIPYIIAHTPEDVTKGSKIILPGVGAFDQTISELNKSGMRQTLDRLVLSEKMPVLGICVGMQLLAHSSEEGTSQGLGWIEGTVKKFKKVDAESTLALPHMGWNTVRPVRDSPLFQGVDLEFGYYFLHSFYYSCTRSSHVLAETQYGMAFASAVQNENIFGVQFHPEKSHHAGIQLLKNFATINIC